MNDWELKKWFEEQTSSAWIKYFNDSFPNVYKTYWIPQKDIQINEHIDSFSILKKKGIVTIDFKTREEDKYEWFKKDNLIFIETWGNDTKLDDPGSSIFNSTAKYWSYGWWVNNKLTEPFVFERKPFTNFIIPFLNRFEFKKAQNSGYNTEGRLIPRPLFNKFEVKPGEFL